MGSMDQDRRKGSPPRSLIARARNNLSSLRLTIAVLLWIAVMCIVATVIPQQTLFPGRGLPVTTKIVNLLNISDMFHSLWFMVPAIILGLNALVCMARWTRASLRPDFIPALPSGCSHEETLPGGKDEEKVKEALVSLPLADYRMKQGRRGASWMMYGEKSRVRALAPAIVHASVLVTILGVMMGFLGFKASMEIPEGEVVDVVRQEDGALMQLPFKVRCDGFSATFYANGMPKEFRSDLTFIRGETVVRKAEVLVNHPVSVEGILFSQSSYSDSPQLTIAVKSGGVVHRAMAEEGAVIELGVAGHQATVLKVIDNVMQMGPAVRLMVETPQGQNTVWVFKEIDRMRARFPGLTERMPEFNPSLVAPYTFTLEKVASRYTTVLGLNKDPGAPFVAVGALLFLIGIIVVFLVPRDRIWIGLDPSGKRLRLKIVQVQGSKVSSSLDTRILEHLETVRGGRP